MNVKLTNLVPREHVRAIEQAYYLRLGAMVAFALALLVAIHGVMLFPSYQFALEEAAAHEAHLAELERTHAAGEGKSIADRLEELSVTAKRAQELMAVPSATGAIRSVLAVPRPGILVSRFALTQEGGAGTVVITGTASTREALRTYHLALQALSFVAQADLPLSSYTAESAIPFSITLTTTTP